MPFSEELDRFSRVIGGQSSIVDQVRIFLREQILSGKLRAGERVVETRIARQLGLGQPTVREALERLHDEGLIVRHVNRGCTVIQLSDEEVRQMFRVRAEWERQAVEYAMESWDDSKSRELMRAVRDMEAAAKDRDAEQYYRQDLVFHQLLWKFSGNPFLAKALAQVTIPLFAFVMLKVAKTRGFDFLKNAAEHRRVATAIVGGDRQEALQIMSAAHEMFQQCWTDLIDQAPREKRVRGIKAEAATVGKR